MDVGKETLKDFVDFVSGVVRVVGSKVRNFASRPKRQDRVAIGAVLTDMVEDVLLMYGLDEQVEHSEHQPVDFVWLYLSFGWECKRFVETEFQNDGAAIAWLKREVFDRFREQQKIIGKPIRHRALVVNEKRWGKEADLWLAMKGIDVVEVGCLDSRLGMLEASMVFMGWFENMIWQICNGGD